MNETNTTAKKLFNALAFANVSTLGEFRTLLRQIDEPAAPVNAPAQHGTISLASSSSAVAQAIGPIQGAL